MENAKTKVSPLDRLVLAVGTLDQLSETVDKEVWPEIHGFLQWHMEELYSIHHELEDEWVQARTDGEVPTVAQGIALAKFMRPHFQSGKSNWGAFISRGGAGLGNDYLHVRFNDGYEGGISKDGSIST